VGERAKKSRRSNFAPRNYFPFSNINRRTASAFSASDNGSEAISINPAENESALPAEPASSTKPTLTVRDADAFNSDASALLEIIFPPPSPCSFSGKLLPPLLPRRNRRFATRCGFVVLKDVAPDFGSEGWGFDSLRAYYF
jgi:hypothetical protein